MIDTYYKAKIMYAEEGICVQFKEFKVIKETNCYAYCVNHWDFPIREPLKLNGESDYHCAKRRGLKIFRIHKTSSRIAFSAKEAAYKNLVYLKGLQVRHLQRELDLLRVFNKKGASLDIDQLKVITDLKGNEFYRAVPETEDDVLQHYHFK